VFHEEKLLIKQDSDNYEIPRLADLERHHLAPMRKQFLGSLNGRQCFAAELPDESIPDNGFALNLLMRYFGALDETLIWTAGRANQLVHWNREHQFCGKCGRKTEDSSIERAKICPSCGLINYPRVSPAIIIAVVKDNQLLLARNKRFKSKFYSVLAGFVEPGETLEECARREIFEEVNIAVKNIRYFGSQPWPFPNSLMVAFTAEYAGGELREDQLEIIEADWFSADKLPNIPPRLSIARKLIDWFVDSNVLSSP
jgi:NAD+ diphosphatase